MLMPGEPGGCLLPLISVGLMLFSVKGGLAKCQKGEMELISLYFLTLFFPFRNDILSKGLRGNLEVAQDSIVIRRC